MNNALNAQELGVVALNEAQLETIEGGNPIAALGEAIKHYVIHEVIDGIIDGVTRPCPSRP